jgi:16S rRNA (uracil1498-N3)-methyltransferase
MRHYIQLESSSASSVFPMSPFYIGQSLELPTHHLTVLRKKVNDELALFDGKGYHCNAILESITKNQAIVTVTHVFEKQASSNLSIELAQCLPTMEKMDWVIEKFTELGGDILTVLEGHKNTVRLGAERVGKKYQRWQDLMIASCTQCGRNEIPVLTTIQENLTTLPSTDLFFAMSSSSQNNQNNQNHFKFLLSPIAEQSFVQALYEVKNYMNQSCINNSPFKISIAVGPESGFSDKEVALAHKNGWQSVRLGNNILRTETVGLTAITLIQGIIGNLAV